MSETQAERRSPSPVRRALVALFALGVFALIGWAVYTLVLTDIPADVDFVLVPPDQTGLPLTRWSDKGKLDGDIPPRQSAIAGSHIVLRQAAKGELALKANGEEVGVFEDVDGSRWSVTELTGDSTIQLVSGDRLVEEFRVAVTSDRAPAITFKEPVLMTSRALVRLDVHADDDFGLKRLTVEIAPLDGEGAVEQVAIAHPTRTRDFNTIFYLDLRDHALAGENVGIRLIAEDHAGQTSETEPQTIRLLKRRFRSADAAILARQNEKLRQSARYTNDLALLLRALAERYGKRLDDTGLTLGFSVAYRQLTGQSLNGPAPRYPILPADDETIEKTLPLLNDLAARMEDRRLADTQERWQSTIAMLEELLAPGADNRTIRAAHWQLRRALSTHLSALFVDAIRHQRSFLLPIVRRGGRPRMPDMIETVLHQLRLDTNHRAWALARQRLDALEDVVENVQSGLPVSNKASELYPLHQVSAALGGIEQLESDMQRKSRSVEDNAAAARASEIARLLRPLAQGDAEQPMRQSAAALDRAARLLGEGDRAEAIREIQESQTYLSDYAYLLMQARLSAVPGSVPQAQPSTDPGSLITDDGYQRMRQLVNLMPMADMDRLKADLLAALAGMTVTRPDGTP